MASVVAVLRTSGTYTLSMTKLPAGNVIRLEGIGSGGFVGTGNTTSGSGGGKGGAYARRNAQAVALNDTITIVVSSINGGVAGTVIDTTATVNSTLVLRASGGASSANASGVGGSTGATTYANAPLGDVTFTGGNGANGGLASAGNGGGGAGVASNTTGRGPNTQFAGVSGGTGGGAGTAVANPSAPVLFGGGAGGVVQAGGRIGGAQGAASFTIETGNGTIAHTAAMSRLATLSRTFTATITQTAVFSRIVMVARMFSAAITHVTLRFGLLVIFLPRTATITHLAAKTDKAVAVFRTASIAHVAMHIKMIMLAAKTASIIHQAAFARAVTIRRTFSASITHVKKLFLTLEARLIPNEGGGIIVNNFRRRFWFED